MTRSKLKLTVGKHVPNDKVEADRVLSTSPADGGQVLEGSAVMAELSAGPAEVVVPNLTGMTPDSAASVLEKVGLKLDGDTGKVNQPGAKDGTVVSQTPKATVHLSRDGTVKVTVQDAALPAPVIRRYEYTLNVDLVDLRDRTEVRIEVQDVDGKRDVESRRRSPGEKFTVTAQARGEQATFRIYYGDRLVKTIVQRSDGTTQ